MISRPSQHSGQRAQHIANVGCDARSGHWPRVLQRTLACGQNRLYTRSAFHSRSIPPPLVRIRRLDLLCRHVCQGAYPEGQWTNEDTIEALIACEIFLRQWWSFIGRYFSSPIMAIEPGKPCWRKEIAACAPAWPAPTMTTSYRFICDPNQSMTAVLRFAYAWWLGPHCTHHSAFIQKSMRCGVSWTSSTSFQFRKTSRFSTR